MIEYNDPENFLDAVKSRYPTYISPISADFSEFHELIDAVCSEYLISSTEQRAQLRTLTAEPSWDLAKVFLDHIGWAGKRLLATKNFEYLRRALAAASLQNNRLDFRDTFRALGSLYLAASSIGINCSPYLLEAADLSSPEPVYPSTQNMRDILAGFEQSAYFISDVAPRIAKYEPPRIRTQIRNVLADVWDPLEVKNGRYQRTEYDEYIHDIFELLVKDAKSAKMTAHLCQVARHRMRIIPPRTTPAAVRALLAIKFNEDET